MSTTCAATGSTAPLPPLASRASPPTSYATLRHGVAYAGQLLSGLDAWMTRKEFDSVDAIRGLLAVPAEADQTVYERAGYLAALEKARTTYSPLVRR